MYKPQITAIAVACLILTGCSLRGAQPLNKTATNSRNNSTYDLVNAPKPIADTQRGSVQNNDKTVQLTPVPAPTPAVNQPEPRKGEKLNFDILDKLDNTKYGWGLGLNKEHKTPSFPPQAKTFIDKYDGIYIGDTSKKVLYLTFDEGYENGYTSRILDTLKANNVKAIFFITGAYLNEQSGLVKRMLDEGHLVGNHTINHPSLPTVNNTTLENEILGLEKQFTAQFGKGFKYFRTPMGEFSERTMAAARQLGYKTVFWSYAYLDYDVNNQKGADNAYNVVMGNLHNGAIILLHAVSKDNTEALDRIIKDAKAQGYTFSPLDL